MSTERRPLFVDASANPGQPGFHEGCGLDGWSITLDGVEQIQEGGPYICVSNATEGWIDFYKDPYEGRVFDRKHGKVVIEWSPSCRKVAAL